MVDDRMRPGLLATKVGITRILDAKGVAEPATVLKAGPCVVLHVRTQETDGYDALQLGFEDVKPHRSTMPLIGHCGKVGTGPKKAIKEVRLTEPAEHAAGDVLTVDLSAEGTKFVDVTGITKGKGFQGVMKRHGFGGMPASHGTERKHRSPGGIGANAPRGTGQSVKKGKRMAGHMGSVRCTMSNLRLLRIDPENHVMVIRGSVPGPVGSVVMVRRSKKKG